MKAKLEIVRFCSEDIVATSSCHGIDLTGWSAAYKPNDCYSIKNKDNEIINAKNSGSIINENNELKSYNWPSAPLDIEKYYHYNTVSGTGTNSIGITASEWLVCTNEGHRYFQ